MLGLGQLPLLRRFRTTHVSDRERLFETILQTGQELVWECDAAGVVTFVSPNVASYAGYTAEEVVDKPITRFIHPSRLAAFRDRLAAIQAGTAEGWWHEQERWVAKDGTEICLDTTSMLRRDESGAFVGFSGTSRYPDVNLLARQRAELVRTRVLRLLMRQSLTIVFQPIVSLDSGEVIGAEALSRFPTDEHEQSPDRWFADAAEVGLGTELELLAVRLALAAAPGSIPETAYLSVNVSPSTVTSPDFVATLAAAGFPLDRLVVEITEHVSVQDYETFVRPVARLRELGVRIAVDDAGAGYASFRHILRLAPDSIKLDRAVIADMDADPARRALAAAVVMFALEVGSEVIAEGVETVGELATAQLLGIDAAQGYLFARPAADHNTWPAMDDAWFRAGSDGLATGTV